MFIFRNLSHKIIARPRRIGQGHCRALMVLLAGALALTAPLTALATDVSEVEAWPQAPAVTADAAILIEAETGTILYSKNIHKQEYPASCTKILTCLIAMERCGLDEMVYLSHDAVFDTPRNSNHIALDVGEAITMEQALNAILIRSANEVSFAVAEHITGTNWQDFAAIMNEKATELGCLNSNFVNPNGLPDDDHVTTAYDLAMIARHFFSNEFLAKLSRTTRLIIPPSETQPDSIIENTKNHLLPGQQRAYEYLVGSKTGYTDAARSCLVSCAEKDGMRLICVLLHEEDPYKHYDDTTALFDYGFSNFTKVNVSRNETKYNIGDTDMFYHDNDVFGNSRPLLALNTEDFIILPQTASFDETVSTISYDTTDSKQAALITYTWNGVEIGTASVDFVGGDEASFAFDTPMAPTGQAEPAEEEESVVFVNILKVLMWVFGAIAALVILVLLILLIRYIIITYKERNRRKRRRYHRPGPNFSAVARGARRQEDLLQRQNRRKRRRRRPRRYLD